MATADMPLIDTPWVSGWQPDFIGTLLFVVCGDDVLLIHKKTGHGAGRINAPGGKLQSGESVLACALRETREEVGLVVEHASCRAEMRFVERDGPQWLGFAFVATAYTGVLTESAEARPFWCPITSIPYSDMWPDDKIWLPRVLESGDLRSGETLPLVGNFLFADEVLIAHEFESTDSLWASLRLGRIESST